MTSSFIKLIHNPLYSDSTYLPNSTKRIQCYQELIYLFWRLIQKNKLFLQYITQQPRVIDMLYSIITYLHEGRKDIAQLGLVHLLVFMLYFLSSHRDLVLQLNQPFNRKLAIDVPKFSGGTYVDYLFVVLFKIIRDSHKKLKYLWEYCLTIIANVSPYVQGISKLTSSKLLSLFKVLTNPKFIFRKEKNYRYCFYLIETFNNILQYQYISNLYLVYDLIHNQDLFYKLNDIKIEEDNERVTKEEMIKELNEGVWYAQLKAQLQTILSYLNNMIPKVQKVVETNSDENAILQFLTKTTVVGILPLPHPILIREYKNLLYVAEKFHTFIWGVIFINTYSLPLFNPKSMKLFVVNLDNTK